MSCSIVNLIPSTPFFFFLEQLQNYNSMDVKVMSVCFSDLDVACRWSVGEGGAVCAQLPVRLAQ